ncbi:hypothetical protein C8F04DRAFT_1115208 [Mycena alexandri]|uniref:Uncharacterized protein n=1 Tax=Mycena alexandri TaxID=1745969 RepID=A0AAD6X2R6_9AGAR|nr:hypothetical protein C8F04DRAFT_1115208 [Mycena alexandri]
MKRGFLKNSKAVKTSTGAVAGVIHTKLFLICLFVRSVQSLLFLLPSPHWTKPYHQRAFLSARLPKLMSPCQKATTSLH